MKRYWLFAYQWHDAGGGLSDFKFDYDSPQEAVDDFHRLTLPEYTHMDECQIIDTITGQTWTIYKKDPYYGWLVSDINL